MLKGVKAVEFDVKTIDDHEVDVTAEKDEWSCKGTATLMLPLTISQLFSSSIPASSEILYLVPMRIGCRLLLAI